MKNGFKASQSLKVASPISIKHESPSKTTATNEEQRPKHFQPIPPTESEICKMRDFGHGKVEIHLQKQSHKSIRTRKKQDFPIISAEDGIGI
jgi:hypothetical protein